MWVSIKYKQPPLCLGRCCPTVGRGNKQYCEVMATPSSPRGQSAVSCCSPPCPVTTPHVGAQCPRAQSQLFALQLTAICQVQSLPLQTATPRDPMTMRTTAPHSRPRSCSTPAWPRGPQDKGLWPAVGVTVRCVTGTSQDPPKRKEKLATISLTMARGKSEELAKTAYETKYHL